MNLENPQIGILVLNHNGQNWLPTIYQSIREQSYPRAKMYLVDNASTDSSVQWTQKEYPEVTILRMPSNLGYCMAYNLAMPYAFEDGCDWVIWANNDIRLEAGCLQELARVATINPRIGILGPGFLGWEDNNPNYYMLGNHPSAIPAIKARSPEPISVDWVEGSFLMVSRRCLEAVGPLDPYLFFYCEETDFCRRARYQGWKVLLVPSALARHYAGGWSEGSQDNTRTMNWLQSRNYYIYHLANPFQDFLRNIIETVNLFGVKLKQYLRNKSMQSVFFETRVFLVMMKDLRRIYRKWLRDKAGLQPPTMTPDLQSLRPEMLRSDRICEVRSDLPL